MMTGYFSVWIASLLCLVLGGIGVAIAADRGASAKVITSLIFLVTLVFFALQTVLWCWPGLRGEGWLPW
jgi:hypothetical protein